MHRIDPGPNDAVRLGDALSLNPTIWRESVETTGAQEMILPFPDGTRFRVPAVPIPQTNDPLVVPDEMAVSHSGSPLWKYLLDVVCILVSVPIWLPVFFALALWIKVTSPGPVFFRQERIGYRGKRFMIFKFRTMKVNVETQSHERHLEQLIQADCPMTKLDASGDPRIISGGRILRAIGLDELPQIFNVLRREMSLVGPRPCTPHEFERYKPWQRERVNATPGLTGYWQVNGKNKTTFSQMVQMDIYYARSMSLWLDLMILFKTIPAIMTQFVESRIAARTSNGASETAKE